jgi:hypothetical protein
MQMLGQDNDGIDGEWQLGTGPCECLAQCVDTLDQ